MSRKPARSAVPSHAGNGPPESAAAPPGRAPATPSFEEAFTTAERAVESLERGDLPLEESLRQYEGGLRALKRCYEILRGAEKRIEVLAAEVGAVSDGSEGVSWNPSPALEVEEGPDPGPGAAGLTTLETDRAAREGEE